MNIWFRFLVVWMVLFSAVVASDNPRAVIIFDASGSMWGQINGVTKIEIARDALKNVVKEWNPSVELGLTVYGHRTKGDCNDIESLIPVGKIDKNRVVSTVMAIKPKGKTPISRSLKKVAEEIKYTEEKATIILISDGKETCDPDPCATAKELEKDGIDFITHVIGFNVDKKTDKQLECIANATGGEYFSAKNATALNDAMKTIVKKVEVVEAKPTPKPVVKKLKNNIEVSASEKEGGKWVKAYHRIYRAENGQKIDGQLTSVNSTPKYVGKTLLDEGSYILQSEYNEFKVQTPFEIKAGEVTKLHIAMGQTGKVEIAASEKEGGKWVKAYHHIYKVIDGEKEDSQTTGCSSYKKKACLEQIAVGKYIIHSSYNEFKKETPIEVKAGEVTKVQVAMGQTGKVEIAASEKEGGKWVKAYHRIYKVIDGEKEDSQTTGCSSYKKKACLEQIAVGKYIIHSSYNEFKKETPIEVKAGENKKLNIIFGQFMLGAKCSNIKEQVKYEVYASSGQLIYEKKSACTDIQKITLESGSYSVEAKISNGKREAKFTVGAEHPNKLIVDLTNLNHEEEIAADQ